jgi:putative aldouronate transport system substrate-binding protein
LTSISGQSKNPERAMMALDLLFADKDLYDLLCLGIEGVHYTKPTSYSYSPIDGSGYSPGIQWVFGSWFNGLLSEGQPEDTWEQHIKGNDEAYASPLMGFVYSTENVQTEFAQMSALMSEYLPGLMTGSVDPEARIPELLGKLEGAGIKTLIEDAQKQIDAWKASQG